MAAAIPPIFALDPATDWDDLENAIAASAQYQSDHRKEILPLFVFAPMTEPKNADVWEPVDRLPDHLFMISIARPVDARLLRAFARAEPILGPMLRAGPKAWVQVDQRLPIADVYQQMAESNLNAFALTSEEQDDPSFFFLRGGVDAIKVFAQSLRDLDNA